MNTDKDNKLKLAVDAIRKDYGDNSIVRFGSRSHADIDVISTGNLLIDQALGVGGFPRGRIAEIFGPESSGKTTLAVTVAAQAQRMGGLVAIVDVEHALDMKYCSRLGANVDDMLISQPDSGEEALRIVETLVRSNCIDVIILDSVAALTTQQEINGEIGDATVGAQARLMSSSLKKLVPAIGKTKTIVIFTNQLREKIGVMWGNPETTPGGRALKFYASIRIDMRKTGMTKESNGDITANKTKLKVIKNKVAQPFREAEFEIVYNSGISSSGSMFDFLIDQDIITKRGSWFSYNGNQLGQGRTATINLIESDSRLYSELEEKAKQALKDSVN